LKNRKSNTSPLLKKLIPPGSVINSFLFFSAELELEMIKNNCFVIARTTSYAVYEFWRCMQTDPERVAAATEYINSLVAEEKMFYYIQDKFMHYKDPFVRSAFFYLLSFYSDSGKVCSGKMIQRNERSLHLGLSRIKMFDVENLHVKFDKDEKDFLATAHESPDSEYLLIPAGEYSYNYFEDGVNLGFEETRVYHKKIKKFFDSTNHQCLLTYFRHSQVFKLYKDYNMTMINEYGHVVENEEDCREVIVANF
jgi:hypothetical protein|tara:strand:- start:1629 stop:2384 length:756 start_codon:yes stop_codon:yes gene_type:complete